MPGDVSMLDLTDLRWRDFVAGHPDATPFHHPDWARLVADCYGFRAFALATRDAAGAVRAGLPLVEVRHLGRRPKWVSLPYTDFCPPLASTGQEQEELASALQRASSAAGIRRVEVRGPLAGGSAAGAMALRHVLALCRDPALVHAGFHHSQVQRSIRRAPGATLVAVVVRGRPWPAVQADLIEGIIATNDLRAEAADRVRAQLWAAIEPTAVEEEPEGAAPVPPAPAEVRDAA